MDRRVPKNMRSHRNLNDRNQDREESLAQMRERVQRLLNSRRPATSTSKVRIQAQREEPAINTPQTGVSEPQTARESFIAPKLATANRGPVVVLQPWAIELARTLLCRANDRKISLRLLWPAEIDAVAGLHAIANLSRMLGTDLAGLRTLLYPGTHATWTVLDRFTTDRAALSELWRSTYETAPIRKSRSVEAVLEACNEIEQYTNEAPPPQVRQLIPAFIYDSAAKHWTSTKHLPLDRLIAKVTKLRRRELLRGRIQPEWCSAALAPGALLVLPRGMKRRDVKRAVAGDSSESCVKADVALIDARGRSAAADPRAMRRLPDFLKALYEGCGCPVGTLIVTDDPTEYFVLRQRLEQAGVHVDSTVLAGESDPHEWLASASPKANGWVPEIRRSVNFSVSILDKQAATLARRFGRIAEEVRDEGADIEEPFRLAQGFVMRASHLPGGFVDLYSEESGEREYLSRDLEWGRLEGAIRNILLRGGAAEQRKPIEDLIERVHKHLADCESGTPLAIKLKEQVQRFAVDSRDGLTILLSSPRNIAVAQRFLARELREGWEAAKHRVEWLTFARAPAELKARSEHKRLVIVGLSPRILRLLATHDEISTGTCLLVPAQKALGVTQTLSGMVTADALKPYRARLSGLLTTLNERLKELPDIEVLTRSLEQLTLAPQRASASTTSADPKAYCFHLEDGRSVHAAGTVFRYDGVDGEEFKRVQARSIEPGDCVFEMSDELRDEIEAALGLERGAIEASPARKAIALYHDFVKSAVTELFPTPSRQESVRVIKARMLELDQRCADVSLGKLNYWISLDEKDPAPHGARDPDEFLLFCRALNIDSELAKKFWERIRRVRYENQTEGRQLNAIYAEILFNPESAQVYRGVSPDAIRTLQGKALDCVFHVVQVDAPQA